jgi:hypothetical protein
MIKGILVLVMLTGSMVRSQQLQVLYKQCDARWGKATMGTSSLTLCQAGCAVSSVAMMLARKGVRIGGSYADPGTLNAWMKSNGGYYGADIVWASVNSLGGPRFSKISYDVNEVRAHVLRGGNAILWVNNRGHWVLATGITNSNSFQVLDPGFAQNEYSQFQGAALYSS